MYLYSALYYFITVLSSTTSHVLLAADIEDFRILAEQFLPEGLVKEILNIDKDEEHPEFRAKSSINNPIQLHETKGRVKPLQQYEKELKSSKRMASSYAMILEDIIEKVRKKLQAELTLMAITANHKYTTKSNDNFNIKTSTDNILELNDLQSKSTPRNLQGRYKKQSRDDTDHEHRQDDRSKSKINLQKSDKMYIANTYEVTHPKLMIDQNRQLAPEIKGGIQRDYDKILTNNNQRDRKVNHRINITTVIPNSGLSNNYDTSREKPEPSKHSHKKGNFYNGPKKTTLEFEKKLFDDFRETTTKINDYNNYEDETTNYNKKKRKNRHNSEENKYVNDNIKHKQPTNSKKKLIEPYIEPVKVPEKNIEKEEVRTKESIISQKPIDIFTEHNSISKYIAPYDSIHNEAENGHRKTEKISIIPKATEYNASELKIPILRENYSLKKHKKHDLISNLRSDINTPVIINGRVVVI